MSDINEASTEVPLPGPESSEMPESKAATFTEHLDTVVWYIDLLRDTVAPPAAHANHKKYDKVPLCQDLESQGFEPSPEDDHCIESVPLSTSRQTQDLGTITEESARVVVSIV